MNEQEQISQLSALFDGELPPEQVDLVIRRALKDPATRARWDRYALIGACVRNEPLASTSGIGVAGRVAARLAAEPELGSQDAAAAATQEPDRARYGLFGRGALGGAIAAGVALVSIFLYREMAPAVGDGMQMPDSSFAAAQVGQEAVSSYTTPIDISPATLRVDPSLATYMVAHSEVASSAYRSAVMYGYDPTLGTVEMTEAEIGARR